jgi:FtsH-binding integral membrane protein
MKKIILYTALIYIFFSLLLPFYLKAQGLPEDFNPEEPSSGLVQENPRETIVNIFNIVFRAIIILSIAAAIIFFAWAGFLIIFKADFGAGKNYIIYGVVGLIIALVSWTVIQLITRFVRSGQLG